MMFEKIIVAIFIDVTLNQLIVNFYYLILKTTLIKL